MGMGGMGKIAVVLTEIHTLGGGDGNDQLVGSPESGTFLVRAGQTSVGIDSAPRGIRKIVI